MIRSARIRHLLAFTIVIVLAVVARIPVLRHPIGLEPSNGSLARAICAARNFETRGFLASGGLPLVAPLPVTVEEALEARDAPLLSWMVYGTHRATGFDFALCARLVELGLTVAAALGLFILVLRRAGVTPAFTAAVFVVLCPMVASAAGSELLTGFTFSILAACALDAWVLRGSALAASAVVVFGALGALAEYRFCLDAAALAFAGFVYLRKDAFRPGALIVLLSPLALCLGSLAIAQRLAGTAVLLWNENYWIAGPLPAIAMPEFQFGEWMSCITGNAIRELLIVPAVTGFFTIVWYVASSRASGAGLMALLFTSALCTGVGWLGSCVNPAWQIRWAAPVAAGCAIAVGWMIPRWRFGAVLLSALFVILLLGSQLPGGPRRAAELEALGEVARARVPFGFALATSEEQPEIVMAVAERPVIANITEKSVLDRVRSRAARAVYPVAAWASIDPMLLKDDAHYAGRRSVVEGLNGSGRSVLAFGPVNYCEFPASAASARQAPATIFRYESRSLELALPAAESGGDWKITIGRSSLDAELAVVPEAVAKPAAGAGAPVSGDRRIVKLPAAIQDAEKLYLIASPEKSPAAEDDVLPEKFLRLKTIRKIHSNLYYIFPLMTGLLALLALCGEIAWPRKSK